MSGHRPRGGHPQWQQPQRHMPPRPRDDFYDDHRSRSRSPDHTRPSPQRTRSPTFDHSRPPTGPSQASDRSRDRSPERAGGYSRDRSNYRDTRSSQSPRRRQQYYDRDRPHDRSRRSRSRSRSRSGSGSRSSDDDRTSSRGRPSKEIIMEGLNLHLTEQDITTELKQSYRVEGLDDVRIIRDRHTKQSRQFGFLPFSTLEDAAYFMDKHYPQIYVYGQQDSTSSDSDVCKVRIAYGRERKEVIRNDDADWTCGICNVSNFATRIRCFRCSTNRSESEVTSVNKASNVGDNDASPDNTPSQFLLFRGLELSVSEELFAKGVAKLNKPASNSSAANQSSSKKGAKVASTTGDNNLGAKDGSLRRILLVRDRKSNDSWRYGFAEYASIEDAQAALVKFNSFDRFTIASKPIMVSYIHAGVFVPASKISPSTERFTFSPLSNPSLKLMYWDDNAYVTELVINQPESTQVEQRPIAQVDIEEGLKTKDIDKLKKRKAQSEGVVGTVKKPAASHLQFWSDRHAELHGIDRKDAQKDSASNIDTKDTPPSQSYADPTRNCCYLCMRQFSSNAEVNKHERLSELHRENLKNEVKVQKANAKLEKHGVQDRSMTPEYRDRARERRMVFGVFNKKGEQIPGSKRHTNIEEEGGADLTSTPIQSKGASLLSKMGYTTGQGLGVAGEGITAPISQDVYVGGVGLGAVGGKLGDAVTEAERNTKGDYSAFTERTREGARERYARM